MRKVEFSNHPGAFIRGSVIPSNLTVKEASRLLGVGRPALSNLLNGKAALSLEMAQRLEKTFGANSKQLLILQTEFEQYQNKGQGDLSARVYVPSFLLIKAKQIEGWAKNNIPARSELAVLLRKLVNSTGLNLTLVDFPGYDNAERKGWDGRINAGVATQWIPAGVSGWEFGCDKKPDKKAEKDYTARTSSVSSKDRAETNFVFVTPFNWPGKHLWMEKKNSLGDWKTVRAYDASDLEQWLEQSIPAQAWFADLLDQSHEGVKTLEQCWKDWASVTDPKLGSEIFDSAIETHKATFTSWISSDPASPLVVSADSKDEALAFLSCLFDKGRAFGFSKIDSALVFTLAPVLRKLSTESSKFIQIVFTDDLEREISTSYKVRHTIIVRPAHTMEKRPDISLGPLSHQDFYDALTKMGTEYARINTLGRESGHSPTVLRRRLSKIAAIQSPGWSKEESSAKALIPLMFVGAWSIDSKADCEILKILSSNSAYDSVEKKITELLKFDDSPVWAVGKFRGVVSKIDAFYGTQSFVTQKDLEDLFLTAEYVLSEEDPALELPEDQRWAAAIYGKVRNHSSALREGLCETIVILAVHGNQLFRNRLGIDVAFLVGSLIGRLLRPLSNQKLLSYKRDLPFFAEASPNEFLSILEEDLELPSPVTLELMKPATSSGILGSCDRTELLWALEALAWDPNHFPRVCIILAKLAAIKINDNWINKADNSLKAIFRSWMPQTSAPIEDRNAVLEKILRKFPEIGWEIAIDQFELGNKVGHNSHRPRWRSDANGFGQPIPPEHQVIGIQKAIDLALAIPKHTEKTLGDLVDRIQALSTEHQTKVWELIESWSQVESNDELRARLRNRIRQFVFTRRGWRTLDDSTRIRAQAACDALTPRDVVLSFRWLFETSWIHDSFEEEPEDGKLDFQRHEERIAGMRTKALAQIWNQCQLNGIFKLLSNSGAPYAIGWNLANGVIDRSKDTDFIGQCIEMIPDIIKPNCEEMIRAFLHKIGPERRTEVVGKLIPRLSSSRKVQLIRCCPFNQETWNYLEGLGSEITIEYWKNVIPMWSGLDAPQTEELMDRLFQVGRPRAAFHAVYLDWTKVETQRLKRLLNEVVTNRSESAGTYPLNSFDISAALKTLEERKGVTEEEMADLEFLFIRVLGDTEHGIPNLERQLAKSPPLFAQLVAAVYKRIDGGEDPPELNFGDSKNREALFGVAYTLLSRMRCIPGAGKDGIIDGSKLKSWINEVRQLCAKYGRANSGDQCIGQVLGTAPVGKDGIWPCEPLREIVEELYTQDIATGISVGINNSRGAGFRMAGGAEERERSSLFHGWSKQLSIEFPSVARILQQVASNYERFAVLEESNTSIQQRLMH